MIEQSEQSEAVLDHWTSPGRREWSERSPKRGPLLTDHSHARPGRPQTCSNQTTRGGRKSAPAPRDRSCCSPPSAATRRESLRALALIEPKRIDGVRNARGIMQRTLNPHVSDCSTLAASLGWAPIDRARCETACEKGAA
jgi:hypothetical protein